MDRMIFRNLNRWVILGGVLLIIFLCSLTVILASYSGRIGSPEERATAFFVIIPAPSKTPTMEIMQTPTTNLPEVINGIQIGAYVQIIGTEGAGLRIRSGPGKTFEPKFSGYDSEVFLVEDGPADSDGITWWLLVAPYDKSRSGWAAANYLTLVELEE